MGCSSKRIIFFMFISFWIIFYHISNQKKNKVFRQTHFTLSSHAYHFQIFFIFLLDNIFQVIKCKKCLGHFSQRKMFFIILFHITHHFSTHIWLLQSIHKRFSWGYYYIISIINFISLFSYFFISSSSLWNYDLSLNVRPIHQKTNGLFLEIKCEPEWQGQQP